MGGRGTAALKDFLTIDGLDRLNGHLHLASPDLLVGRASVRLRPGGLREPVQQNYRRPPIDLRTGVASFLPAADTFLLAQLRTDPFHLLDAIHRDVLTEQERQLWQENVYKNGALRLDRGVPEGRRREALATPSGSRWGAWAGSTTTRSSRRFESENRDVPPNPAGALAFVIPLRKGAVESEVDEFIAKRVHLMGFSSELERVPYREFTTRGSSSSSSRTPPTFASCDRPTCSCRTNSCSRATRTTSRRSSTRSRTPSRIRRSRRTPPSRPR